MANRRNINPKARADLDAIWWFITVKSQQSADAVIDEITETFYMLTDNPRAGRLRVDLLPNLRSFAVGSYTIFYIATNGGIDVIRVMHGKRDISAKDMV